ncbi:MAG: hypothetical protein JWN08_753 [Frankiales bacterium]|nr:hypothetical protein [Frankiales bacterium]
MDQTMTSSSRTRTPATGLSHGVVDRIAFTAPISAAQGTGLSFAGRHAAAAAAAAPAAQAAVAGVRSTDLPGPVPRGAVV